MPQSILARLQRWRGRLVPDELQLGWTPIFFLGYLAFLFLPSFFPSFVGSEAQKIPYGQLGLTLASVAIFLPLYFLCYWSRGLRAISCTFAIALLALVLLPINAFANTYLIYAIAFCAILDASLWRRMAWMSSMLGAFLVEILILGIPVFVFAITAIISIAVFFANHFQIENARKRTALKLSHDEVRRLAALAERERIGRDLHDLLGHTLSLIALKSELAGKLLERDPKAARREVDEVARVARDALSQVRHAVSGIRAAGLAAELASARQLLESDGISFSYSIGDVELSADQETALALVVREAVTNVQRHAHAHKAQVVLEGVDGQLRLLIEDDGRGGSIAAGNGLNGMRERVEALGGRLHIESVQAEGTRLEVTMSVVESIRPVDGSRPIQSLLAN